VTNNLDEENKVPETSRSQSCKNF